MGKLITLLLFISLSGCSTFSSSQKEQKQAERAYKVVNLGKKFEIFWEKAKSKPFEEQLKIWDEIVEAPHQDLYDTLVYSKAYSKDWYEKKIKRLNEYFADLPQKYEANKKLFDSFETTLAEQIKKFSARFPDSMFTLKIYAVPGASFNGKSSRLRQSNERVLAFGPNIMILVEDDPDVLYSHELFHIYHLNRLNIDETVNAKLTLPLWMEGLAAYVSQEMNPEKGEDKVLMSKDLPKVSQKDIKWLAKEFLKNAADKSFNEKDIETYQKWFNYGKQVRNDIPTRPGYLLGYLVAKELGKKHSSYEMAGWNLDRIDKEVKATLAKLAE